MRVVLPDADTAARLARLSALACQPPWSAAEFIALGAPPKALLIADAALAEALVALQIAADEAEILTLGVVPGARRRGLASDLLRTAQAEAGMLGCTRVLLEVATDNAPARALYARHGYLEIGRRRAYYLRPDGTRQDALVLAKAL